jgi:hypothetical protein
MPRKKAAPPITVQLPSGAVLSVGEMVAFHRNGWHYGHLDSVDKHSVKVRPIGPRHGRLVTVPIDDLKEAK